MTAEAVQSGVGTEILDVELDLDPLADPPVIISDRNKHANSGDKIKWMKKSGSADFKFIDFKPDDAEFGVPDIMDNKIECTFTTTNPPNTKHHYTILVEDDCGKVYTSDKKSDVVNPDEGRAVIRN